MIKNRIINGDSIAEMAKLPDNSVDLIFADPPYNMQLGGDLTRPDQSHVDGVFDAWDQFDSIAAYENFSAAWLKQARRVLKDDGSIWVIGSYHNIYLLGSQMQRMGFWFINDVVWNKTNPMPNFRGTRLTNAQETLLWMAKSPKSKYCFNYELLKTGNDDVQMRSVWDMPLCTGAERLKGEDGKKAHSTQKPEALLYRVLQTSTKPGDVILDPFFGTGTTGAVAKKLGRKFIGIERDPQYVEVARARINAIRELDDPRLLYFVAKREEVKVPFVSLIEHKFIEIGQPVYDLKRRFTAEVQAGGQLLTYSGKDKIVGSIHKVGAIVQGAKACNGWDFWNAEEAKKLVVLDEYRTRFRRDVLEAKVA